jgi:TldD protein
MKASEIAFFNPAQQEIDWTEILALAQSNGGDYADIFWERSDTTQIVKKSKSIETLRQGTDEGVGIRVIVNGQTIYGYTNELSGEGVRASARAVVEDRRC